MLYVHKVCILVENRNVCYRPEWVEKLIFVECSFILIFLCRISHLLVSSFSCSVFFSTVSSSLFTHSCAFMIRQKNSNMRYCEVYPQISTNCSTFFSNCPIIPWISDILQCLLLEWIKSKLYEKHYVVCKITRIKLFNSFPIWYLCM